MFIQSNFNFCERKEQKKKRIVRKKQKKSKYFNYLFLYHAGCGSEKTKC